MARKDVFIRLCYLHIACSMRLTRLCAACCICYKQLRSLQLLPLVCLCEQSGTCRSLHGAEVGGDSLPFTLAQCGTRHFSLASEVSPPSPNLCESGATPYSDRYGNTESTPKLQRLHTYLISFNNGASTIVMYGRRLFSMLEQRLEFLFLFKITTVLIFSLKLIKCDL